MAKMARKTLSSPAILKKDGISNLPDEILILVLSRLGMKEAARTSVLSHRWKDVWKFYTGCFQFEAPERKFPDNFEEFIRAPYKWDKFQITAEYVYWVNKVLDSHQGHNIEELRISVDLDKTYTGFIDRWFDFAISRSVRRLELDFSPSSTGYVLYKPTGSLPYSFPTWLLDRPLGFTNIAVLTSLRLRSADLTEEVVQFFLSNCPMLEQLCVDYAPSLHNLTIAGDPLHLKRLEITNCLGLEKLHILAPAPNLVSFKYWGPSIDMLLKDVPKLSSLALGGDRGLPFFDRDEVDSLAFSFPLLEEFSFDVPALVGEDTLDLGFGTIPEMTLTLPKFTNLRKLELKFYRDYSDHSILSLSFLVHVCPRLEKLVLNYDFFYTRNERWDAKRWQAFFKAEEMRKQVICQHKHVCLKVLEFYGWIGLRSDFELATYLIETSRALEEIIIHPSEAGKEAARVRASHLEHKLLSSRTKLIIFDLAV